MYKEEQVTRSPKVSGVLGTAPNQTVNLMRKHNQHPTSSQKWDISRYLQAKLVQFQRPPPSLVSDTQVGWLASSKREGCHLPRNRRVWLALTRRDLTRISWFDSNFFHHSRKNSLLVRQSADNRSYAIPAPVTRVRVQFLGDGNDRRCKSRKKVLPR